MYGRNYSSSYLNLSQTYKNQYLVLPPNISFTTVLSDALNFSDKIFVSIPAQNLPSLFADIKSTQILNKIYILCMKGLIENTGMRLSQVATNYIDFTSRLLVWLGPGHVENFLNNIPSCMLLCSNDSELAKGLCNQFSSKMIRFYYGSDLIGNEVGAATKNVMGIAAGMLDGMGLSTLKGPLMARGTREISRLVKKMGGNELTIYGLCHLGDYEATLFSPHSHNHAFGQSFIQGKKYHYLAEGVSTLKSLMILSQKYDVDLPISEAIYKLIFEADNPKIQIESLFLRSLKSEF